VTTIRTRATLSWLAATLVAAAGLTVLGAPVAASADPLGDARARAAALAATVDRLETRAELATERYDAVQVQLGTAVTRQALAERLVEADQSTAQAAQDQVTARVRALYESGGRATLLATVLAGSDPADALSRLHMVSNLLSFDSAGADVALAAAGHARILAARLTSAASRVTRLQQLAAGAATHIRSLLDARQAALSSATDQVRALAAQHRAALAAASAMDFQAALAAAGSGPLSAGTTPPNALAAGALAAARSRLGAPYVWGATGPNTFDCSGLTQWSYAHVGIRLPRVAADQWNAGPHVTLQGLEPGDLLFWATDVRNPATIHHVAIYLGAGMMLAAPHTGDVVKVQPVYMSGYIGATRPYHTSGQGTAA
jgi:cell wall-associated NlpC family hydrolase